MAQHDYSIANQGFPATRADINNALSAIATNNSGTSAPSTQYAGQFWIDTTSSTWTLYIHDGTDDIQFATIDTSANTINFTDSALDVVTDTTPQLGGDLDLNSNNITGTGDINITGDITASGSLLLGTALAVAEGGTGLTSGFANGITIADQWYTQTDQLISADTVTVLTGGTGWSRTPKTLMGSIGLNMSESSGVFTFPSTGIYYINFKCEMTSNSTANYRVVQANIQGTTNNSTYNTISTSSSNFGAETSATFTNVNVPYIVDITDTANQKIRFTAYFSGITGDIIGDLSSADTRTMVTFVRIGDT